MRILKSSLGLLFIPTIILLLYHGDWLIFSKMPLWHTALHVEFAEKSLFFKNLNSLSPLNLLGQSIFENPTIGLFSPFNIFYLLLDSVLSFKLSLVCQYVFLFFGLYYLFSKNILWATCLSLSPLLYALPERSALGFIIWIPWFFYFFSKKGNWSFVGSFITLGFMAALGDIFITSLSLFLAIFIGNRPRKENMKKGILILAFLIAMIFPIYHQFFLQFPLSSRSHGIPLESAMAFSLHLYNLIEYFIIPISKHTGWFSTVNIGPHLFILIMIGYYRNPSKKVTLSLVSICFILLLTLGEIIPIVPWAFSSLFPFSSMRYPVKFLTYTYPFLFFIFAHIRNDKIFRNKYLITLCFFFAGFSIFLFPKSNLFEQKVLLNNSYLSYLNRTNTRLKVCDTGLFNKIKSRNFNTRGFLIANINSANNTGPDLAKILPCQALLIPQVRKWLGVTHLVTPFDNREDQLLREQGFIRVQSGKIALYQSTDSKLDEALIGQNFVYGSPLKFRGKQISKNHFRDDFRSINALSEKRLLVSSEYELFGGSLRKGKKRNPVLNCPEDLLKYKFFDNQISIHLKNKCDGILSIPWRLIPGWRAYVDGKELPILWVNGWTMGAMIKKDDQVIKFIYENSTIKRDFLISFLILFLLISGLFVINREKRFF
jgi:hypothetical protein